MRNPNRKVYGLSLGAILPALGFSLTWFCCLPIAAGALGAEMAAAGGVLTPLRPYFTVAAVALLGAAFYYTYKRRNTECAPGAGCAIRQNVFAGDSKYKITYSGLHLRASSGDHTTQGQTCVSAPVAFDVFDSV